MVASHGIYGLVCVCVHGRALVLCGRDKNTYSVHLFGLSIEHINYQDVRNHEHQTRFFSPLARLSYL
jgi:hypothetical protein